MNGVTLIDKGSGIVECRICGLNFIPNLAEDRERHEHEHRVIMCGGMPYELRELLKSIGWCIAEGKVGLMKGFETPEIGKRAVVYAYWLRALMNGIPENELERFMAAQFKFVDAMVSGDEEQIKMSDAAIQPWRKYGG